MSNRSTNNLNFGGIDIPVTSKITSDIPTPAFLTAIAAIIDQAVEKRMSEIKNHILGAKLTGDEVCEQLKCTKRNLYNLRNRGELMPCSQPGKSLLYDPRDVQMYLNERQRNIY